MQDTGQAVAIVTAITIVQVTIDCQLILSARTKPSSDKSGNDGAALVRGLA